MRSLLFVPGNKENMLSKALGCRPDVLVPDLEDSVPEGEKPAARALVAQWLPRLAAHGARLMPRVNALGTEWFAADVTAMTVPGVWGLSIGKVESAAELSAITDAVSAAERSAGMPEGSVRLVPWIETARAIIHCHEICLASDRIEAVAFGGEDFANDLGIERLDDESNVIYARSVICTAARAAGLIALDTPWFQFRDLDGLARSSEAAKRLGFKGRFAIHPGQIETINACFGPSENELVHARRIVEAYEEAERQGRGSTSLDGRVIDIPVVKRARALLAEADRHAERVP